MINWSFNANDIDEGFQIVPVGDHRVRISAAEEKKSKTNKDMIAITLDVSGNQSKLFYYLVFMPDNTTMTNTNLKRLWDSFGIETGNMNIASWVGKVGAARVKHEEYNGDTVARTSYFIEKAKQGKLPAWVEPGISPRSQGFSDVTGFSDLPPFDADNLPDF